MKRRIAKYGHGLLAAVLITLFTGYALLDVFVIPHEYADVAEAATGMKRSGSVSEGNDGTGGKEGTSPSGSDSRSDPVITDRSYKDSDISVEITEYRVSDTNVYVADVRVSSAEYLFSALAKNKYGRNIKDTTSAIAKQAGAIIAVNGDFYGARNHGYVIRNGVLYRSAASGGTSEDLVLYKDGTMKVIRESGVSAETLLKEGAAQVWAFGPGLISDGEMIINQNQEVGQAMASNPRTAIAYVEEGRYLLVVSDGRTSENDGLSLYELAAFLKSLGAVTAYNLDGGGSSTMVFMGKVINNPTTNGRNTSERSVSDIVCVGYRKQ